MQQALLGKSQVLVLIQSTMPWVTTRITRSACDQVLKAALWDKILMNERSAQQESASLKRLSMSCREALIRYIAFDSSISQYLC